MRAHQRLRRVWLFVRRFDWYPVENRCPHGGLEVGDQWGVDKPWTDAVDSYAALCKWRGLQQGKDLRTLFGEPVDVLGEFWVCPDPFQRLAPVVDSQQFDYLRHSFHESAARGRCGVDDGAARQH